MATEEQIRKVLNSLLELPGCHRCGVRIRFGDYECPRCGADLDDDLREWAVRLIDDLAK
jgi:hypothetical protein